MYNVDICQSVCGLYFWNIINSCSSHEILVFLGGWDTQRKHKQIVKMYAYVSVICYTYIHILYILYIYIYIYIHMLVLGISRAFLG